ncbi:uncharacterized protein LOC135598517 isoform X1 [Musa acuminata AAA Group]|uniref:uncharacterized protein LOC135598517 isoform X1 n=1 Tax=Musa acuminata AAA Group TaxID=214697 RepID=UPI0031DBAAD9
MEFRRRSGEEDPPSGLPANPFSFCADGHIRERPLRVSFLGFSGDLARAREAAPISLMNPLQRAIEKERIREEILREMTARRILEEEVRRELEVELATARAHTERLRDQKKFASVASDPKRRGEHGRCLLTVPPEAGSDEVGTLGAPPMITEKKDSQMPALDLDQNSNNSTSYSEVQPSDDMISEKKRKVAANATPNKAPRLATKDWGCALCRVTATGEMALNEHLQGKRHKAKVAALQAVKTGAKMKGGNTCSQPDMDVANEEGSPNNEPKIVNIAVDGKMHQVLQKGTFLWCEHCNVKCNSHIMMTTHLSGKKHRALMKLLAKASSLAGATIQTCDREIKEEAAKKDNVEIEKESIVKKEKEDDQLPNITETAATGEEGDEQAKDRPVSITETAATGGGKAASC